MDKSKKIQFFANELKNVDKNITTSKRLLQSPLAELSVHTTLGGKEEIQIWEDLKKPLSEFLENYFKEEKEKIYKKISNIFYEI